MNKNDQIHKTWLREIKVSANAPIKAWGLNRNVVKISSLIFAIWFAFLPSITAEAHGFNANHVDIVKTFGKKYRVIIKYTHVELGEYREAHIDFEKKDEAIKAFQDLVKGADFFLGDVKKSIHFHTPPETNTPY
jgi:hypothetical protein